MTFLPPDSPEDRWESERIALVRHLEASGIYDRRVLEALARVPRHLFAGEVAGSYEDRALPIGSGQTISQPYMVAYMTQALAPIPESKVLEAGTGSGYQAAVLAELSGQVCSVERLANLAQLARTRLYGLGYGNVQVVVGDGTLGYPEQAPYDRIIGTAALPAIPPPWVEQLAEGGVVVAPVGSHWHQMLAIGRKREGRLELRQELPCIFVPMIGKYGFPDDA